MRKQNERKEKYEYLRKVGLFKSDEANALKDRSWKKVEELAEQNPKFIAQRKAFIKNQTKKGE